jgi:tRNA-Thr(GGU) m(6)t(6)A37 methyltransferase TsaA
VTGGASKPSTIESKSPTAAATNAPGSSRSPGPGGGLVSMLPIGVVRSCFRECRGTPRQGHFAPATRGRIEFSKQIQADCTLGLEDFSHVWIVFLFHMNTNVRSVAAAQAQRGHNFKSRVKPPKLRGRTVGVFCTRAPHRPNAVGLTLAKLDRVDGRTLHISALDLTDGTPVLDVKPYVPVYDSLPDAQCPAWCVDAATHRQQVSFTCEAIDAIDAAAEGGHLQFYTSGREVRRAIQQLLENDVRPDHSYRRFTDDKPAATMHFRLDMLKIGYTRLLQGHGDRAAVGAGGGKESSDGGDAPREASDSDGRRVSGIESSSGEAAATTPHVQVCEVVLETQADARAMELGLRPRYT